MESSFIQKYFFTALLVVAFALGFLLFWPFLKVIILAAVLAVVMHPLFRWFKRIVRFPKLASLLTLISFIIILCVPLYFIGGIVLKQLHSVYAWLLQHDAIQNLSQNLTLRLQRAFPSISFDIQGHLSAAIAGLIAKIGNIFTTTVSTIVYFIWLLLCMFYFLKDGADWKEALVALSPLSTESNVTIITILKKTVNGLFRGYVVVGVAQGLATGLGFYLFHVPHPALFGLLAAFASLIPAVGSSLVSLFTVIFLLVVGRTGAGIGYAVWAISFGVLIDDILSPYVVGKQIEVHPLLVLFSVLGGAVLMGPIGILIGPLITSFIYALIAVFKLEMASDTV